jgi:hypothetical protein
MGTNSVARIAPQFLRGRTIHLRPNWRRDLNHVLASTERRFVDSPRTFDHRAPIIEHAHRAVTLIPTTTKPFNVLAEGLFSKKNSGRLDLDRRRKPRPTRHPGWHDRGPLLHAVLSLSLGRPSRHRPRITGDRVGMVSPEQSYIYIYCGCREILWMQRNLRTYYQRKPLNCCGNLPSNRRLTEKRLQRVSNTTEMAEVPDSKTGPRKTVWFKSRLRDTIEPRARLLFLLHHDFPHGARSDVAPSEMSRIWLMTLVKPRAFSSP